MSDQPIGIVPDETYPKMYRLIWADGVKSKDFYNLTRAKDNLKYYDKKVYDMKKGYGGIDNESSSVS